MLMISENHWKKRRPDVTFRLINGEDVTEVECSEGAYRNLMVLINEQIFVEDFGECKGIGRCGTCLVEIHSCDTLPAKDRNEMSTLQKCSVRNEHMRLSCQIMTDHHLDGAIVQIVESREDVR